MTIKQIELPKIDGNPWQVRLEEDEAHIQALAESIAGNGLLQIPLGRIHPGNPERVQLAFGHSRLSAYRLLASQDGGNVEWTTFPVDVRDLSDRQLSDLAAEENSRRKNLSAIETAAAIRRRMQEFKLTQLEAGQPFGYVSQGSVANLLRLLDLPDDVQAAVARQELPERAARQLLPLMKWRPPEVSRIAKSVLKAAPDARADKVDTEIWAVLRDKGQSLNYNRDWPLDWPKTPQPVPDFNQSKGEPAEVPACRGCDFYVRSNGSDFCLRPPCFAAKTRVWARAEAERASRKLGLPLAGPGEKVTVIFDGSGDYRTQQQAEKLVKSKHTALRLVAIADDRRAGYGLRDVTGTKHAVLATVDKAATDKIAGSTAAAKSIVAEKPKHESPAQKEKRLAAEAELKEERWLERSKLNRSKADVLWLLDNVAGLIAAGTVASAGLLHYATVSIDNGLNHGLYVNEVNEARQALREQANLGRGKSFGERGQFRDSDDYSGTTTPELDAVRRKLIAYSVLANEVCGYKTPGQVYGNFGEVRETAQRVAAKAFGVQLPAKWDEPPIHRTAYNCWTCGTFAGNERGLTKGELKDGWLALWRKAEGSTATLYEEPAKGAELAGCFCPAHAPDGEQRLHARPLVEVFLQPAESRSNGTAKHVRGHTKSAAVPIAAGASTGKLSRRAKTRAGERVK